MFKIEDYIKYYKDVTFNEISLNDIDLSIMTIMSYLPVKPFNKDKKLNTVIKESNDVKDNLSGMQKYSVELINLLKDSERFKDIVFNDFTYIVDSQTQFAAMKIKFNGNTVISYKGTDNNLIGWKEDFRLSFMYPVYTQAMAKKYLNDHLNMFDSNIYLVGHSKGGNLAISASMECKDSIYKKIKRIVNFDGPGVLDKEFKSDRFNRIKSKLINYLPENSVVGILMNNTPYYVVKADGIGFTCHNMANWYIFGTFFEKSELSKASLKMHENNLLSLKEVKTKELEKVVETFFAVVENNDIKKFTDIRKMKMEDIIKTINDLSDVSSDTKKYFMGTLKTFMMPRKKK